MSERLDEIVAELRQALAELHEHAGELDPLGQRLWRDVTAALAEYDAAEDAAS